MLPVLITKRYWSRTRGKHDHHSHRVAGNGGVYQNHAWVFPAEQLVGMAKEPRHLEMPLLRRRLLGQIASMLKSGGHDLLGGADLLEEPWSGDREPAVTRDEVSVVRDDSGQVLGYHLHLMTGIKKSWGEADEEVERLNCGMHAFFGEEGGRILHACSPSPDQPEYAKSWGNHLSWINDAAHAIDDTPGPSGRLNAEMISKNRTAAFGAMLSSPQYAAFALTEVLPSARAGLDESRPRM